jgi:(5-formylfuran-3-yl)methyl phosphate synthase
LQHLPGLAALRPDFAGFRSAVCATHRGGALDAALLRDLIGAIEQAQSTYGAPQRAGATAPPASVK